MVSASATMDSVEMYSKVTSLRATRSRAKWCTTSMCLERLETMGFLSSLMAVWLSAQMATVCRSRLRSWKSLRSHRPSLMVVAAAMYSASVVEAATVGCRREAQEMAPPLKMKA